MNASIFLSGKILPVCLHDNFPLFIPANEMKHRQLTDGIECQTENYQNWYWLEKEYPSQVTDTTSIWYTKHPEVGFASTFGNQKHEPIQGSLLHSQAKTIYLLFTSLPSLAW